MATGSVIGNFTLEIDELGWTGQDLHRPESVVAEPDGTLWVSDGRGGVTRIDPDGGQVLLAGWGGAQRPGHRPRRQPGYRQHRPRDGAADDPRWPGHHRARGGRRAAHHQRQLRVLRPFGAAVADLPNPRGPLVASGRPPPPRRVHRADRRPWRSDRGRRHLRHQRSSPGRRGAVPVRRRDDEGPHPTVPSSRRRISRRARGVRPRRARPPAALSTGSPSTPTATCGSPRWSATASACSAATATGTSSWRTPARTPWSPSPTSWPPAPPRPRTCWPRRAQAAVPNQRVLRRPRPAHGLCGLAGHVATADLPVPGPGSAHEPLALSHASWSARFRDDAKRCQPAAT